MLLEQMEQMNENGERTKQFVMMTLQFIFLLTILLYLYNHYYYYLLLIV